MQKQKYLLIDDSGGGLDILDSTFVASKDAAENYFFDFKAWIIGEVMSESDFLALAQNESELNALENQSPE